MGSRPVSSGSSVRDRVNCFLKRINMELRGLPAPLAMAKLYNVVMVLASMLEEREPGILDKVEIGEEWEI